MSDSQPPPPPPPPPSQPPTGADETAKKPWWKRWWGVTLIVLGAFIVLGAILDDPEDTEDVAADAPPTAEPTAEEPTTEEVTEEITEEPTTPEPEPTTEPEPTETPLTEGQQRDLFVTTFEGMRTDLADALEDTIDVETVDRIEVDGDGNVILGITSTWASSDNQREGAWGTGREMAYLWSDDFWVDDERDPVWWPSLSMTVSEHSYNCSGETMRDLAERRLDRDGWESSC